LAAPRRLLKIRSPEPGGSYDPHSILKGFEDKG
jgi:hypothetical protein